jgi:hypothetical protein
MRRPAVAALVTVTALLVPAAPAGACSSDESSSVRQQLTRADGAFVGRLVKRRGNLFVYRVDTRVKGRIGSRVRVHGLRDCGPSKRKGRRIGMVLDRFSGRWEATAFSEVPAGALLKAAGIGP